MSILHRIEAAMHAIEPPSEARARALERIFHIANDQQRRVLDQAFLALCGRRLSYFLMPSLNSSSEDESEPILLHRALLNRLRLTLSYEIASRLDRADFENSRDDPVHKPTMRELHEVYAEVSYELGIASVITIECAHETFRVDTRGYPIDEVPSAHHGLTRVDLAQWKVDHPFETPMHLFIDDIDYEFTRNGRAGHRTAPGSKSGRKEGR
jgi:hypothetical protein